MSTMTNQTADPVALRALIERIEQATGPDRAIDAEVSCLLRTFPANAPSWLLKWQRLEPAPKINSGAAAAINDSGEIVVWWNAAKYTDSLDAALTAVPEGMLCRTATYGEAEVIGEDQKYKSFWTKFYEATADGEDGPDKAARALLAATLKARL